MFLLCDIWCWGEIYMKNKIVSILVCMLLTATNLVLIPNNNTVQAEEPDGDGPISSNEYEYLWSQIFEVANVIKNAYFEDDIRKGRFMGSKGEEFAREEIIIEEMTNMGLSNVREDEIKEIDGNEIYYNRPFAQ